MALNPNDPEFRRMASELVHDNLKNAVEMALSLCDFLDPPPWREPRASTNLPEMLARVLGEIAEAEGAERLTEHRPGSWEAVHVRALGGVLRDNDLV